MQASVRTKFALKLTVLPFIFALSSLAFSEVIDFENKLTDDQDHLAVKQDSTIQSGYILYVSEGVFIDDTRLSEEWSEFVPNESYHPTKFEGLGTKNISLISQRIRIGRTDGSEFYFCGFSVSERREALNAKNMVLKYVTATFEDGQLVDKTISVPLEIDKVVGYQTIDLTLRNRIKNAEITVAEPNTGSGFLIFDDFKVHTSTSDCS